MQDFYKMIKYIKRAWDTLSFQPADYIVLLSKFIQPSIYVLKVMLIVTSKVKENIRDSSTRQEIFGIRYQKGGINAVYMMVSTMNPIYRLP